MRKKIARIIIIMIVALLAANVLVGVVFAQDEDEEPVEEVVAEEEVVADELVFDNLNTVWLLVAGFLVFFMQAGFALVEAGFVRAKNVVNILMKNFFDLSVGAIVFWVIGFGIMFGSGNDFFGTEWFLVNDSLEVEFREAYSFLTVPILAFFFFQFAFAATAATIASGAMAGRTEFKGYLIYSGLVTALIYPIVGHWIWGGGWLSQLDTPFHDFAGSTVVHSTGGWVGLTGAILLGPRIGRFGKGGRPIPGHSMTMAALGTFILWLGWFGFNPGSQLDATATAISHITVTTNLAAASGALVAMGLGWIISGKPQIPWALNGALAGLVSITAPCFVVSPASAIAIGAIGGVVMYFGVGFLESMKIDDPVGAVSVHGFCGVWGTLSVGIFATEGGLIFGDGADQLVSQVTGVAAVGVFVIASATVLFTIIKMLGLLRVSPEGEIIGLDIYEHGMVAYPEFTNSPSEPVPAETLVSTRAAKPSASASLREAAGD